jgi:hypothetical protein
VVPGVAFVYEFDPHDTLGVYTKWILWIPIAIVLAGQALLLFVSVDTSRQRLKPRAHILVSCLVTGTLWALLTGSAILSLGYGIYGDHFGDEFLVRGGNVLASWGVIWVVWAVVFYLYFRTPNARISRVTSWLLKGSVLELLIAVPAHVMARRRHDCSAPMATSFGIATGIAIMLLSFGPSVLLLYAKRANDYASRKAATQ